MTLPLPRPLPLRLPFVLTLDSALPLAFHLAFAPLPLAGPTVASMPFKISRFDVLTGLAVGSKGLGLLRGDAVVVSGLGPS